MTARLHPSEQALAQFIGGESSKEDARRIVRHLLSGCESCREAARRHWPFERAADESEIGLDVVGAERLASGVPNIEEERRSSRRLLVELMRHPTNRRTLLVLNSSRFHSWFLAGLLVERLKDLVFTDPKEALETAELAVALSERLSEQSYGSPLVNDMRARCWGALGNCRRLNSDLRGAEEAFQKAESHLELGSGDPLEEARLHGWRARYMLFKRDLKQAVRLYDKEAAIFRRLGDDHEAGRALIDRATPLSAAGDYHAAIETTERGLELIDSERDPRIELMARHNLTLFHHHTGDIERATTLLREVMPLHRRQNDAMMLLKLRWLEGHLAQAQGELSRAEEAFRDVQQGFLEREIPYDAAAVSFDLATILLERGQLIELRELAAQILAVFSGLKVHRETLAAFELFQSTIEARQVTAAWIAQLASYVGRSAEQPGKPFAPTA